MNLPVAWTFAEDILPMAGFGMALLAVLMIPVRAGGLFNRAAKAFFAASILCYVVSTGASIAGHFAVLDPGLEGVVTSIELLWVPFILFGVYALYSNQQLNDSIDARHAVVRAGEMLESVMNTTPAGVVVLDDAGVVTFANPEARRLLDLDGGLVADMSDPIWSVTIADDQEIAGDGRSDFRELLGSEPLQNSSVTVSWPNGWRRRLVVNTAPITDESGAAAGAVAAFLEREPWTPSRHPGVPKSPA
jgi:PAS domain-containing protein